jgi:hypothetical protein
MSAGDRAAGHRSKVGVWIVEVWRMKIVVWLLVCACFIPAVCTGQSPPVNADSIEVNGILIIAGIDKFEYGPNERLDVTMQLVNFSDSSVAAPPGGFCAMTFLDETWCPTNGSDCIEYSEGECLGQGFSAIPPGTMTIFPTSLNGDWPRAGDWTHTLGRVRFWNPWDDPWTQGSSFELSVTFHRSPLIGVGRADWGSVKILYR